MVSLFPCRRGRTYFASGGWTRARRGLLLATAPVLLGLPACSAPDVEPDLESVPADATVGAPPVAPPTPIETYADGRDASPAPDDQPAGHEVIVTYAEWNAGERSVDVGGYLSVIASDGRCTLRIVHGGRELAGDSEAWPDASTTSCGTVRVVVPAGLSGTWEGTLEFTSGSVHAASEPFTVTVP
jgi:hypothetical protein